jgi:hypothetical protein
MDPPAINTVPLPMLPPSQSWGDIDLPNDQIYNEILYYHNRQVDSDLSSDYSENLDEINVPV